MLQRKMTQYGLQICSTLLLFTVLLTFSPSANASLRVEWREGHLSVSAEKVPLARIIEEITRQSGMEIRSLTGLQELVSVRFVNLPLHEGIQQLFVNYLVVWETPSRNNQRPVLAVVSGPKTPSSLPPSPSQAASRVKGLEREEKLEADLSQEERIEALRALAKQGNEEALRKALFDADPTIQMTALALLAERDRQGAMILLLDATKSEQTERRLQALQLLYQTDQVDERTALATLSQALTDTDRTVKTYAIQALAAWEGTNTLGYLRQALRDPDPAVRMLVVEQAALREQSFPLLREALGDGNEAVRSLASSLMSGQ